MHPDLSAPAAEDRRHRLIARAEQRRVLRAIDRRRHWPAAALAAQVLLHRWPWRWPATDGSCAVHEKCSATLIGHLE